MTDETLVWVLQNLDTGAVLGFTEEHLAMHAAEKMVGNRAFAKANEETILYGPEDGNTSVLIRRMPRKWAVMCWPNEMFPFFALSQ